MGGGIAIRLAHDRPELVASLTLIGAVGPLVEKSEVGRALDRGENPLVLDEVDGLDTLLTLVTEKPPPSTRAMRRYLGEQKVARRDAQLRIFRGWNEPRAGEGLPTDLESIRAPTLVIHGACDRVVHPSTGRAYGARLPDVRLRIMEGIGHVPQMEAPAEVARAIDALVSEVESRSRRVSAA
jgi:pimeloyl-ACP methyl ester carboxylesterase